DGFAAPGTPPELNKVGVLQIGRKNARNILILNPGTSASAAYFAPLAKTVVKQAKGWAVWAVERRGERGGGEGGLGRGGGGGGAPPAGVGSHRRGGGASGGPARLPGRPGPTAGLAP